MPRTRTLPVLPEYKVKEFLKTVPRRYRAKFRRALTGTSRVDCMETHCLWCQGFDYNAVVECDVMYCPLWRHRPGAKK